jgi:hypothetical protein
MLLAGLCLLCGLPAAAAAQTPEENIPTPRVDEDEHYAVTVDNRGFRDVVVYVVRGGIPVRLGMARSRRVSRLRANCGTFLNRSNSFLLRSIAGESYGLAGAPVSTCDQVIRIVMYPIGLEYSTIWIR